MVNLDLLSFYSELNYMKRSDTYGVVPITFGSSGVDTSVSVTHGLGYDPFFIVGCDLFNDGIIWSSGYVDEYTESSSANPNQISSFHYWCDDNILTMNLRNGSGSGVQSGARDFYYGVYIDYA